MAAKRKIEIGAYLARIDERLKTLTPRQTSALVVAIGVLFLLLGFFLGNLLAGRQLSSSSGGEPSTPPTPQSVTRTGVLREFKTSQDGVEFYLEMQDDSQILLNIAGRFESSFIRKLYKDTTVTVEGTLTKSGDGSKDILRVEKIVIKY